MSRPLDWLDSDQIELDRTPMPTTKHQRTIIDLLIGLTLISYALRDADGAFVKYILSSVGLQFFWFFPDLLGCLSLVILACTSLELGLVLFFGLVFYSTVGYLVTGSLASVGAGLKMLLPVFCGLVLPSTELRRSYVNLALMAILVISCLGVFYSYVSTPPWSGMAFETGDSVKAAKTTMYYLGQTRTSGLNEDPHGAAFSILALCMLVFVRTRSFWRISCLIPLALAAIYLTTSRSSLVAAVLYITLLFFLPREGSRVRSAILRLSLFVSFLLFVVPLGLMIYFSNISVTDVSYAFRSLFARARESWILPFEVMDTLAPYAYLHGYGIGGVGFPLLNSNVSSYFSPVDNFFLFNYLMFGLPYALVYVVIAWTALREHDQYKYILLTITTIFGHFILGYGSSLFLIIYAYSINGLIVNFRLFSFRHEPVLQPLGTLPKAAELAG